ncbi:MULTISPECIES: rhodanese-related sulfurtransferase [unclassified Sphingomonas]|uniref:oxygen-dependent tRNA uridine(34) hydroxylase TrhO n=1 Tax=unclassified Sphingomonas TaxID=196159 RepID=UPI0025D43BF7|nr:MULTISPECIES: rhodanese-related sulfurtransferase [unclassified Sphingomonas]
MFRVCALYRFTPFADPAALKPPLLAACEAAGVRGTLLLAHEGINGTIAGPDEGIDAVLAHIRALPGCAALDVKDSRAAEMPFYRTKVRVKREIVTMGEPAIDPLDAGHYVDPADWNALIADPATVLIDTRNDYEVAVGTFAGAVDPDTRSFREFPAWFRDHRDDLLAGRTRVAMFCTGGIRCEKATAFLKAEGVDDVFHLKGGILKYLEEVPAADSSWTGECFVFDERVAVGHGLAPGTHGLCRACRMPVSEADRGSPLYEEGVSCPRCHDMRDDADRARYAERHRQALLAEARGEAHVGRRYGED